MSKYTDYLDGIAVDSQAHGRIMSALRAPRRACARPKAVWLWAGLPACAALIALGVCFAPGLLGTLAPSRVPGASLFPSYTPGAADFSLYGLPVDNYSLTDIPGGNTAADADRILFNKLAQFAGHNQTMVAFVRAADTAAWEEKDEYGNRLRQTSLLLVLSVVWSRDGDAAPGDTLTVAQSLYGGCLGDEKTNMLRKGGVYLLPLVRSDGQWYVMCDLDVLFEVDEHGRVWSHSDPKSGLYEDFTRFDGKNASELAQAITDMMRDPDYEKYG
ncbi:MAG: hypothetical protein LBI44_03895 [Oscillospiraceae bacterium]|nr:hypothetical protein [Oscillospiraceae bacterium]